MRHKVLAQYTNSKLHVKIMKRTFIKVAIVVLVVIAIGWYICPSKKSLISEAYRHHERIEAFKQYSRDPSPANWSVVEKERTLIYEHAGKRDIGISALLLTLAGVLVFWLYRKGWGQGVRADSALKTL